MANSLVPMISGWIACGSSTIGPAALRCGS
jgi:hypothetical protein